MIGVGVVLVLVFATVAALYRSRLNWSILRLLRLLGDLVYQIGLVVKLKILFGFMQVAVSLNSVYDAKLPNAYTAWVERALGWMGLDLFPTLVPTACVSSGYRATLVLTALSPLACAVSALGPSHPLNGPTGHGSAERQLGSSSRQGSSNRSSDRQGTGESKA